MSTIIIKMIDQSTTKPNESSHNQIIIVIKMTILIILREKYQSEMICLDQVDNKSYLGLIDRYERDISSRLT